MNKASILVIICCLIITGCEVTLLPAQKPNTFAIGDIVLLDFQKGTKTEQLIEDPIVGMVIDYMPNNHYTIITRSGITDETEEVHEDYMIMLKPVDWKKLQETADQMYVENESQIGNEQ